MGHLQQLAHAVGADERTLRRAVAEGTLRVRRPSPRTLDVSVEEQAYLQTHWPLLRRLRAALRTEPNVRLAVLFGSAARGDDGPESDVDLLIRFDDDAAPAAAGLARRLEDVLDRDVDVARLDRVREREPLLLVQALDEGRVVADRDGAWPMLVAERDSLARRGTQIYDERRREARATLARLAQI